MSMFSFFLPNLQDHGLLRTKNFATIATGRVGFFFLLRKSRTRSLPRFRIESSLYCSTLLSPMQGYRSRLSVLPILYKDEEKPSFSSTKERPPSRRKDCANGH